MSLTKAQQIVLFSLASLAPGKVFSQNQILELFTLLNGSEIVISQEPKAKKKQHFISQAPKKHKKQEYISAAPFSGHNHINSSIKDDYDANPLNLPPQIPTPNIPVGFNLLPPNNRRKEEEPYDKPPLKSKKKIKSKTLPDPKIKAKSKPKGGIPISHQRAHYRFTK